MNTEVITLKNKYRYGTLVKKMLLCHFGAAMLGIMISVSNNTYLVLVTTLLSFAFYMYILYTSFWDIGAKDKLAVDGGRMKADPLVGLKAALFGSIPSFAIGGLCFILKAIAVLFGAGWADYGAYLFNIIARFWNGMYIGIFVVLQPAEPTELQTVLYMLIYLAVTVPALVACLLAYRAGLKGKRVFPERKKN